MKKLTNKSNDYAYPWYYNGNIYNSSDIGDSIGFVYIITNTITNKKYIGKKLVITNRKVKGKRKKCETDWKKYYGSSDELKNDVKLSGVENFERTIIRLCNTKAEMSYYESKLIFEYDCLLSDQYYNKWVMCRITASHLKNL